MVILPFTLTDMQMKNRRLEERRAKIPKYIDIFVQDSFDIVDRIHQILVDQGKEQKDLAVALGKTESEISKWMTGTHNFTMKTLSKIAAVLGEPIILTIKDQENTSLDVENGNQNSAVLSESALQYKRKNKD